MWYDMGGTETRSVMTDEGRALLTSREREILSGDADVSDNYRYKVQSIVRKRLREHLAEDVRVLEANFPEAHDILLEAVREVES